MKQLQGSLSSDCFLKSGAAISMALADVSLNGIMDHVGWKSSKTALHYIKLREVLNPAGPAAKLADLDADLSIHYKATNELKVLLEHSQNNLQSVLPIMPLSCV